MQLVGRESLLYILLQNLLTQRVRNVPTAGPFHRSTRTDLHLRALVDFSPPSSRMVLRLDGGSCDLRKRFGDLRSREYTNSDNQDHCERGFRMRCYSATIHP